MATRTKDTILADRFTKTGHSKPSLGIDPSTNKLTSPLTVCVVGASRGIGAQIAYAYAQAGAGALILVARSSSSRELSEVEKHVKSLNLDIRTATEACDITSSTSVSDLAQKVKSEFGKLDILVLNSGYSGPVILHVDHGDPKDFQDVFDVNVQGTYLLAHYFIPLLKESNGEKTFIAINSLASCIINGHIANTAYCTSKLAQSRLVEFIAEQYGEEGVLAVAVHPGAVATEMANQTTPDSFRPYLTDDVALCGAFCVWWSRGKRMWLNGRLVSATWDVDELLERMGEIEKDELLKFSLRLNGAG